MLRETDSTSRPPASGETDALPSSGADRSRYREVRSHLVPRTGKGKLFVALFLAILLLAEWPLLPLANRIDPAWLGIPFLFSYLLVVYVLLIAVLLASAYLDL